MIYPPVQALRQTIASHTVNPDRNYWRNQQKDPGRWPGSSVTEWSITISAGASGLTLFGSPPSSPTASRMVARSTMQGTPVKSCMITRAASTPQSVARAPCCG